MNMARTMQLFHARVGSLLHSGGNRSTHDPRYLSTVSNFAQRLMEEKDEKGAPSSPSQVKIDGKWYIRHGDDTQFLWSLTAGGK